MDYENCKCRKKLVDKLVEECTKTVEEVKIAENQNENMHKCNSCTLYIVLFSILVAISVGIGIYFVYSHLHLKKDDAPIETTIYLTYKWEKSNKLRPKIKFITFTTTLSISKISSQNC